MRLERLLSASAAAIALLALIAGCNSGESQSATARDVATASEDAAEGVAKARDDAARDMSGAAKGAYDVEMAKAEGDHRVATEKCGTLVSDALKACTSQADADFNTAKARAQATLDAA